MRPERDLFIDFDYRYWAYILHNTSVDDYKVGYTSKDPDTRAIEEDRRQGWSQGSMGFRGNDSLGRSIEVEHSWPFRTSEAALFIELAIMRMFLRLGAKRSDSHDWFDVDAETIEFVVEMLGPMIAAVQQNESAIICYSPLHRASGDDITI